MVLNEEEIVVLSEEDYERRFVRFYDIFVNVGVYYVIDIINDLLFVIEDINRCFVVGEKF